MTGAQFVLARCTRCSLVFVEHPRTDFDRLYDAAYYAGDGADRTVDYIGEMANPKTVRTYEWRGIVRAVAHMVPVTPATRWLDFGCGLGGLVRWVREHHLCEIVGYDDGYAADWMAASGIPHVSGTKLAALEGSFDVVTAIEVLEHSVDPRRTFEEVAAVLRPGGLLFLTTGNAAAFRDRLGTWSYTAVPDVHVAFYEPSTLVGLMERVGLEPVFPGYGPGMDDIIRYKVLKGMRVHQRSRWEQMLPWSAIGRVVDRRYQVSAMPAARRL
jgi:SAM-dependent methyltransferase